MATVAKFVQPIPILLAYLVPLDVDVFSINFQCQFENQVCDYRLLGASSFKMAAIAMEMAKMLKKNEKHKKDHSKLIAEQKLMKLDRSNIHI